MAGLLAVPTQAHIVGLGWTFNPDSTVTFDALHWHGNHAVAGALIIDGTSYPFTSVTWDTAEMTGLDGALVNASYSAYDGAGTLTAISTEDNWLHVTVSLTPGEHTIGADYGPGGLTSWTLDDSITSIGIVTPPPPPPSNGVPDTGSTLALLGLGVAGLASARRLNKK